MSDFIQCNNGLMRILWAILFLNLTFGPRAQAQKHIEGPWLLTFHLGPADMPVRLHLYTDSAVVINGSERIRAAQYWDHADSLYISLPVFDSFLQLKWSDDALSGEFVDRSRTGHYRIAVSGQRELSITQPDRRALNISGRWRMTFSPTTPDSSLGIGIFVSKGDSVLGTVLTPTGDHRYLAGTMRADSLFLSAFDGSHLFHYRFMIKGDSIRGRFYSGRHWQETLVGKRDSLARLPPADSITYLRPGTQFSFSFPDGDGNIVSLADARYLGRAVVVQIMGSWCPNCMDETAILTRLHRRYGASGLEVVALAFERTGTDSTAFRSIGKLKQRFDVSYPILLAGSNSKTDASARLPMLNHVAAFPTTVFIDRKGIVRRISTGFNGPASPDHHSTVNAMEGLIRRMLAE